MICLTNFDCDVRISVLHGTGTHSLCKQRQESDQTTPKPPTQPTTSSSSQTRCDAKCHQKSNKAKCYSSGRDAKATATIDRTDSSTEQIRQKCDSAVVSKKNEDKTKRCRKAILSSIALFPFLGSAVPLILRQQKKAIGKDNPDKDR